MTLRERVEQLQQRFPNMPAFDINGKNYTKPYVQNIEGLVINLEDEVEALKAEIIRLKISPCDTCANKQDGLYNGKCFTCSWKNRNNYEAKK